MYVLFLSISNLFFVRNFVPDDFFLKYFSKIHETPSNTALIACRVLRIAREIVSLKIGCCDELCFFLDNDNDNDVGSNNQMASHSNYKTEDISYLFTLYKPSATMSMWVETYGFNILFSCLSVPNVVEIISCLLTEESVLLITNDASCLMHIANSLLCLIFPLQWSQVYIPVLPRLMSGMIDCPVPYLIGIEKHQFISSGIDIKQRRFENVTVVDIDDDSVVRPVHSSVIMDDTIRFITNDKSHVERINAVNRKRRIFKRKPNKMGFTPEHSKTWKSIRLPDSLRENTCRRVCHLVNITPIPPKNQNFKTSPKPEDFKLNRRLRAFYRHWAPEKLFSRGQSGLPHLHILQQHYKGRVSDLFDILVKRYGPEPMMVRSSSFSNLLSYEVICKVRSVFLNLLFQLIGNFHVHEAAAAHEKEKELNLEGRVSTDKHDFIRRVLKSHMWQQYMDSYMQYKGVNLLKVQEKNITIFDEYADKRIAGIQEHVAAGEIFPPFAERNKINVVIPDFVCDNGDFVSPAALKYYQNV